MAKEFYDSDAGVRELFDCASEAAGVAVDRLCFEENDRLNQTEYTQIAMITAEAALLHVLKQAGVQAELCAGLSLGEYAALLAAGVMALDDVFHVVRRRGQLMQDAYPEGGAMTAVLGADAAITEEVCRNTPGIVSIANDNCPGQLVISGEAEAVAKAEKELLVRGAKRCVPLKVSGPFHSSLLAKAGEALGGVLEPVTVKKPQIPYLSNVTADYVTEASAVKSLLVRQVSSPVRWRQSIERMLADGTDLFVEIGPGRTLSGFLKRISKEAAICSLDHMADLEQVLRLCGR